MPGSENSLFMVASFQTSAFFHVQAAGISIYGVGPLIFHLTHMRVLDVYLYPVCLRQFPNRERGFPYGSRVESPIRWCSLSSGGSGEQPAALVPGYARQTALSRSPGSLPGTIRVQDLLLFVDKPSSSSPYRDPQRECK